MLGEGGEGGGGCIEMAGVLVVLGVLIWMLSYKHRECV